MIGLGVVPIINENDTVVTDEIRFGDNDTLAAVVANLIDADLLVILTDRHGLYDADPRTSPKARLVSLGRAGDPALDKLASEGGALGRGGMITKLRAARLAARSGASTVIVGGRNEQVLTRLAKAEDRGTLLLAGTDADSCPQAVVGRSAASAWVTDAGRGCLPGAARSRVRVYCRSG